MPLEPSDLVNAEAIAARTETEISLPELFLENTKLRRHQAPALQRRLERWNADPSRRRLIAQGGKNYRLRPQVCLPFPPAASPAATQLAGGGGKALSPAVLAWLLSRVVGDGPLPPEGRATLDRGPNPLEIYLAAPWITGLPTGVYHYHPLHQGLELVVECTPDLLGRRLRELMPGSPGIPAPGDAAAVFLISGVPARLTGLYGDRGYRSLLLAAGKTLQRLEGGAQACALRMNSAETFFDEEAHRLLGLDGVDELVLALAWVSAPLALSPPPGPTVILGKDALVVTEEDSLHVVHRRGSLEMRAEGLGELHRRLAPHLDGRHTVAEILAAVPAALRTPVESYLRRLRQAGALSLTSAAGDSPAANAEALITTTPHEAGRRLLRLLGPETEVPPWTALVVEAGTSLRPDEQRAFARWLGTLGTEPASRKAVRLYRLQRRDRLERIAVAAAHGGPTPTLETLPKQLGLIRDGGAQQLPLVVTTAEHPYFPLPPVVRYGLDYRETAAETVLAFLGQAVPKLGDGSAMQSFFGEAGAPITRWARLTSDSSALPEPACSAPTLPELCLEILAQASARHGQQARTIVWQKRDLLAETADHPQIRCLRRLLGLRRKRLLARVGATAEGAVVVEAVVDGRTLRGTSFVRFQALRQVLLESVWTAHYDLEGRVATPLTTFLSSREIRCLARDRARAVRWAGLPRFTTFQRIRCWGLTLWRGHLENTEETHV